MNATLPPLIVIVGPTAVGKTETAIRLCTEFRGEIVSADSRQIFRGMDIGTAKPNPEEQTRARHHLIDIVEPDQKLSLAEFQQLAYRTIDDLFTRRALPFLVGGTGQWVQAVVQGWGIPQVPPDVELRTALEKEAREHGPEQLHARLAGLDPQAARRIDHRNVRRVVRALEVCLKTGQPITLLQAATPPPYRVLQIGLTMPRPALYARIDRRIDRMIESGLVKEVQGLLTRGYSLELPSMSGLGYRQVGQALAGHMALEDAVQLTKKETRRFVRQQYNWFRLDDPAIHWFDVTAATTESLTQTVQEFLAAGLE